jgi:hypothetical protein
MFGGLDLFLQLNYSWGLGEVSWDLFMSLLVSAMVQAQPATATS